MVGDPDLFSPGQATHHCSIGTQDQWYNFRILNKSRKAMLWGQPGTWALSHSWVYHQEISPNLILMILWSLHLPQCPTHCTLSTYVRWIELTGLVGSQYRATRANEGLVIQCLNFPYWICLLKIQIKSSHIPQPKFSDNILSSKTHSSP